ncbi:MAG: hypothetical protein WCC26_12415 [Terracidiphilus sp.]
MVSFRRLALLLALALPAVQVLPAQDSTSSSTSATQDQAQTPSAPEPQQSAASQTSGQTSVQARIRARRDQRRAQAIHDTYSHPFEVFTGGGYIRFTPGPNLQKTTMYSWDAAITRYYSERLGVTIDGRGYYGTAFVGLNLASLTRPAISQYAVMGGPTYRLRMRPKYSISVHGLGGVAMSDFSGDTGPFGTAILGLYPDATTYAFNGGILGEANLSPTLSLRLGGDYYGTGFGSTMQNNIGFQYGFVYRFGKR